MTFSLHKKLLREKKALADMQKIMPRTRCGAAYKPHTVTCFNIIHAADKRDHAIMAVHILRK